ncbi:MAG: hypothetical protein ABIH42_06490 [Planctomycetota bacterium]
MEKTKSGREGQVRCLNCLSRFSVPQGVDKIVCPKCKMEWRISWYGEEDAKIRGPVWDKVKNK